MKISSIIISKSQIVPKVLLESISFSDEIIVVVDSPSQKTIARGKVKYLFNPLNNSFSNQRNFALKNISNRFGLFVDSDEYVSRELKNEITHLREDRLISGYKIPRRDIVFHQQLRYGENGGTEIIRLVNKDKGKFVRDVHEKWEARGCVTILQSTLYHQKDNFVSEFLERINTYGSIDAKELKKEGKPYSIVRLVLFPIIKFVQNYILKKGILDGYAGLFYAYLMSVQSLSVRVFQWQIKK